jgi:hypothetical protein
VYPPVHSFCEELESMKIFVGIQTNCYANTRRLWSRVLSAVWDPRAATITVTCSGWQRAEDVDTTGKVRVPDT